MDDAAAHRQAPTHASLRQIAAVGGSPTDAVPGRLTPDQLRVALGGQPLNPPVPKIEVDEHVLQLLRRFHALPQQAGAQGPQPDGAANATKDGKDTISSVAEKMASRR